MASLVTAEGTSFELADTGTLLGRGGREFNDPPKVDVGPLPGGATVSRRHARVSRRGAQWYLRVETEARNPTIVAGRRIPGGEEIPLTDGSHIQIGDVTLVFRVPVEAPQPAGPDVTMADGDGHGSPVIEARPQPVPIVTPSATLPPAQPAVAPAPAIQTAPPTVPTVAPVSLPPAAPVVAPQVQTASWPGRLPPRPATLAALGVPELKRVNPFRGLMIDEQAWADAHDYHRVQNRLHILSSHGWGVVEGLEVVADPQVPNTLLVRPGVAVDSLGRALLVTQERRLAVALSAGTALYVTVRLREEMTDPQRFWNDLDEYTRVVERCEAMVQAAPPTAPAMELARMVVDGPVRNAVDPLGPQSGEIDLRFRERLMVRPRPELGVGQLVLAEGETTGPTVGHRLGLRFLLREMGLTTAYRARWAGIFHLGDPLPPVSMLYMTGAGRFTVPDDAIARLRDFLGAGGVIFADGCRQSQGAEFAAAAEGLAGALGCTLQPVGRGHPLLTSRHVFAEVPSVAPMSTVPAIGQDGARVLEGGGLVVSTLDLGCAWQGGPHERALLREQVRSALEFGVNVAVYGRQRQRPLEIVELEA